MVVEPWILNLDSFHHREKNGYNLPITFQQGVKIVKLLTEDAWQRTKTNGNRSPGWLRWLKNAISLFAIWWQYSRIKEFLKLQLFLVFFYSKYILGVAWKFPSFTPSSITEILIIAYKKIKMFKSYRQWWTNRSHDWNQLQKKQNYCIHSMTYMYITIWSYSMKFQNEIILIQSNCWKKNNHKN